ncbi:hypothetical protein ACOMHN_052797 [Nucella lapillus]
MQKKEWLAISQQTDKGRQKKEWLAISQQTDKGRQKKEWLAISQQTDKGRQKKEWLAISQQTDKGMQKKEWLAISQQTDKGRQKKELLAISQQTDKGRQKVHGPDIACLRTNVTGTHLVGRIGKEGIRRARTQLPSSTQVPACSVHFSSCSLLSQYHFHGPEHWPHFTLSPLSPTIFAPQLCPCHEALAGAGCLIDGWGSALVASGLS